MWLRCQPATRMHQDAGAPDNATAGAAGLREAQAGGNGSPPAAHAWRTRGLQRQARNSHRAGGPSKALGSDAATWPGSSHAGCCPGTVHGCCRDRRAKSRHKRCSSQRNLLVWKVWMGFFPIRSLASGPRSAKSISRKHSASPRTGSAFSIICGKGCPLHADQAADTSYVALPLAFVAFASRQETALQV